MRIGVDIGGTKIEAIALGPNGTELVRKRIASPQGNYTATLESVKNLVNIVETRATRIKRAKRPATIGIGIPGTISPVTGLVKNANSTWLIGHQLDQDLTEIFKRPIKVANDANCFAMSEAIDGAAMGHQIVFAVILGTGVGGGLCVAGEILTGLNAIAGEWGHNPLPWPCDTEDQLELSGQSCYCGQRSCIETFLSGKGLERSHAALSGTNLKQTNSPTEISALANKGQSFAIRALDLYATRLAKSLATIINIIDPEVIVLGGGLSNIEFLYKKVPQLWSKWVFSDKTETKLVKNKHGDSSGVRGAAFLWPDLSDEKVNT